jgi:hypothetical protein
VVEELERIQQMATDDYAGLLQFFGEDAKMAPEEFFGILSNFLQQYEVHYHSPLKPRKQNAKTKLKLSWLSSAPKRRQH